MNPLKKEEAAALYHNIITYNGTGKKGENVLDVRIEASGGRKPCEIRGGTNSAPVIAYGWPRYTNAPQKKGLSCPYRSRTFFFSCSTASRRAGVSGHSVDDIAIKIEHQLLGLLVRHRPHTHDQAFGPGLGKDPAKAIYSFTAHDFTKTGFACGKNNHVRAAQFEGEHFFGRKDAVTAHAAARQPVIGPGQGQPGPDQRG